MSDTMAQLGWWTLVTEGIDLRDLDDESREHIASLIRDGFTEGQIVQGDEPRKYGDCKHCAKLIQWSESYGAMIDDQNDQYCPDGERHELPAGF